MAFATGTKRFRRDAFGLAARLRVITYVCEQCGEWGRGPGKPAQCRGCGSMAFFRFDSKAEAERWATLQLFEKKGLIFQLRRQERIPLLACGGERVGHYVADFSYFEAGAHVIEDLKGNSITDLSAWKIKHVEAQYGVKVKLVKG